MKRRFQRIQIRASVLIDRAPRVVIGRDGTVRERSLITIGVLIENLSETGCLFRSGVQLPLDTLISVGVPGIGNHAARVRRVAGDCHGCEFILRISTEDVNLARSIAVLECNIEPLQNGKRATAGCGVTTD